MSNNKIAVWFLRIGLAFVFVYASIEIFINPQNFLKYTPAVIFSFIPVNLFLYSFAAIELLLAVWLLTGWQPQYSSILTVLCMVGIIVFNMEYFQVLFRNVAIAFGGLALLMLETNSKIRTNPKTHSAHEQFI